MACRYKSFGCPAKEAAFGGASAVSILPSGSAGFSLDSCFCVEVGKEAFSAIEVCAEKNYQNLLEAQMQ